MNAKFSECGQYRYLLERELKTNISSKTICFIMLNPSIANSVKNDSTVTRCIRFSEKWGYTRLTVVNLFALISTDPNKLYNHPNPIGPENNDYLLNASSEADLIIAAWGNHGQYHQREAEVKNILAKNSFESKVYHIGSLTKENCPRHPLYLGGESAIYNFFQSTKKAS